MVDAAEKLKVWRLSHGYTLEDAGTAIGCDFTTLSKIENKWQRPGRDLLFKIERVTGISGESWSKVRTKRKSKTTRAPEAR